MTTGRINQVTILTEDHDAPRGVGQRETPGKGGSGSLSRSGEGRSPTPGPGTLRQQTKVMSLASTSHPVAPTEFPKGRSAADAKAIPAQKTELAL